ncbi:MAG: MFS transporter [Nonomuraea sp.]|nr:MFS transporter [Nonomuraea sp.]
MPLSLFFLLDGVFLATWVVRIPSVKDQLGVTAGGLGVALMCMSIGTVCAMTVGGKLCARYGTRPVILVANAVTCLLLPPLALASTLPVLCVMLAVTGLVHGAVNIGLNSAAVEVEQHSGRPVMSRLHGLWSVGGLLGALIGGLVAARLTTLEHFALMTVLVLASTAALAKPLLQEAVPAVLNTKKETRPRTFGIAVVMCGILAVCAAVGEGSVADWSVLHLRDDLHAGAALAAYGFSAYSVAIALARLTGSELVRRRGQTAVLVSGAALAVAGILTAAWAGSVPLALGGFVLVGLGLANVFPLAIAQAGALGGPSGVGLAASIGHAGMLGGPPVIGFLADHVGLPGALTTVAITSAAVIPVTLYLRTRRSREAPV